jgi:hypothetical protein
MIKLKAALLLTGLILTITISIIPFAISVLFSYVLTQPTIFLLNLQVAYFKKLKKDLKN